MGNVCDVVDAAQQQGRENSARRGQDRLGGGDQRTTHLVEVMRLRSLPTSEGLCSIQHDEGSVKGPLVLKKEVPWMNCELLLDEENYALEVVSSL